MGVFRVEKVKDYTTISNYHLRDKRLSLKAKGLLTMILALPEDWNFTIRGLSAICKEGVESIGTALKELEKGGYLVRKRVRVADGRMNDTEYNFYEEPIRQTEEQPEESDDGQSGTEEPEMETSEAEQPHTEKPDTDNPFTGKPCTENPAQLNTNQVITNERNNSLRNYQSINLDGMDRMDEREQYRELIRDNLEIDIRSQDKHYDLDRVNEIVEIILDAVCSTSPTIRINGEDMPQPVVKSRFLKLDSGHIDYVLQAMNDCPSDIRNIRAYLLTALYNASLTIDNYYSARVNYDFHGKG